MFMRCHTGGGGSWIGVQFEEGFSVINIYTTYRTHGNTQPAFGDAQSLMETEKGWCQDGGGILLKSRRRHPATSLDMSKNCLLAT